MTYSMNLKDILALVSVLDSNVDDVADVSVTDLVLDSRKAGNGSLFFAYPGVAQDGRDYLEAAQASGAAVIIYEAGIELAPSITVPAFAVADVQSHVGRIANEFYGQPSSEMQVFGVTGTNGKTSCCYLLTQALEMHGLKAAMIGTIGVGTLSSLDASGHTTPDPITLHKLLADFRDQEITQVCMEVSSHALDQGRVNGVQFFCTLFTNLSHDHLDYHGDMGSYAASKRRLFTEFHSELVITNANDNMGIGLIDIANADFIVRYGVGGDVLADDVELTADGISLVIEGNGVEFELSTPLVGKVNVPNIELVVATLLALSSSVEDIQTIASQLKPAPGRMELLTADDKATIVVDFAHTPDALDKALESVKEHCRGKLWCIFGCGGDRDQDKRPLMGQVAAKAADYVVITNDNPRSESPESIAKAIKAGAADDAEIILDRAQAIKSCIEKASADDWIVVAGKGHETTQTICGDVFDFSDSLVFLGQFCLF